MKVYIIGVGLGNPDTMTIGARNAIAESQTLLGASRLLEGWPQKRCIPAIAPEKLAEAIDTLEVSPAAVLFSGDVGFYSGAKKLYPLLARHEVVTIPGVSSVQYLCAKCLLPWQDVRLVSAHGRAHNALGEIQSHEWSFVLTGGSYRAEDLCRELTQRGLGEAEVIVGQRLSYPEERIVRGTARVLAEESFDSLASVLVHNPQPLERPYAAPFLEDGEFLRGKVPMTKEEIRCLAVSKLRLRPEDTVWDVGAGTGSVSIECACAACRGQVFAVERKPEAVALLEENREKFRIPNLTIVEGLAPEVLVGLPAPDRVFLGGTAGSMEEILRIALEKNPRVRVVATAVTLETIGQALGCFEVLGIAAQAVQVAVTRTRQVGAYHMPEPLNPVWIVSGEGRG